MNSPTWIVWGFALEVRPLHSDGNAVLVPVLILVLVSDRADFYFGLNKVFLNVVFFFFILMMTYVFKNFQNFFLFGGLYHGSDIENNPFRHLWVLLGFASVCLRLRLNEYLP